MNGEKMDEVLTFGNGTWNRDFELIQNLFDGCDGHFTIFQK